MLEVKAVSKKYGDKSAIDSVSFQLGPGIHGLLGPSGAGKSTLMDILACLIQPSSGFFTFLGKRPEEDAERYIQELGYLPQHFSCCENFTGRQMLVYFAFLKGMKMDAAQWEQMESLIEKLGMKEAIDREIRRYSRGMRQCVGILQALLGDPHLLILDEPTAGLDPKQKRLFCEQMEDWRKDRIVLLSAQSLSEEMESADHVILLKEGRVARELEADGDLEAFYRETFGENPRSGTEIKNRKLEASGGLTSGSYL